jgi:hypothetical protein
MRRKATGSIQSNFAILDVKTGRAALHKRFKKRDFFGECPERMRIPVLIRGYIDGIWGGDDGASREFSVVVTSVLETRKRKGA